MLWSLLYGSFTRLVLALAVFVLPLLRRFRPKLAKWIAMRYYPRPMRIQPKLWIHAVSVGEIQIAHALLGRIELENFLVTTTTQAAYQILRQRYGPERVRYLPWDIVGCYKRMFGQYQVPPLLVVETEIWPVLFRFVHDAGAALVIVNGRVSARTMRLRNNGLFRSTLAQVTRVLARGEEDKFCFMTFGVPEERVEVLGNIKFDSKPRTLEPSPLLEWLQRKQELVLFASISNDEAPLLAPQLIELMNKKPQLRALWVPRHLEDLDEHLEALKPLEPQLRSRLQSDDQPRLLVLDSFGELSGCYAHARLSLVGGSFNQRGGQNFIESLQVGTPVLIGPSTENFREETREALEANAILQLTSTDEVATTLYRLLNDTIRILDMQQRAASFLGQHGGAIERTCGELQRLGIL